jgi:L-threonylcarbamoyladenylate synthase
MHTRRTERLVVDPNALDEAVVVRAGQVIRAGGLVAFPTETVYGLGADALDARAVLGIFEAKGRPPTNPIIVHVEGVAQAREVVRAWPEAAEKLAARFWPGPLTLVLARRAEVPAVVSAGLDTVAVRAPAHPVARALLRAAGRPIAAPSANRSTEVSPTTAAHVMRSLDGRIDVVLDGGPTDVGIESTVLSLAGERPVLLRPGHVTRAEIEAVIGPIDVADASVPEAAPRASPGLMERHYAPRARVVLVPRGDAKALDEALADEPRAAAIVHTISPREEIDAIRLPDDPVEYARALYAALHDLDARAPLIAIERVPDDPSWDAVRDRLARASR